VVRDRDHIVPTATHKTDESTRRTLAHMITT
jgi:hypothetical protein